MGVRGGVVGALSAGSPEASAQVSSIYCFWQGCFLVRTGGGGREARLHSCTLNMHATGCVLNPTATAYAEARPLPQMVAGHRNGRVFEMAKCEFLQKKKRKALKPKAAGIRLSRRQLGSKVNQMWPVNQRCVYFYFVGARTNMQPAVSIPVAPSNKVSSLKEVILFKSEKKKSIFFFGSARERSGLSQ